MLTRAKHLLPGEITWYNFRSFSQNPSLDIFVVWLKLKESDNFIFITTCLLVTRHLCRFILTLPSSSAFESMFFVGISLNPMSLLTTYFRKKIHSTRLRHHACWSWPKIGSSQTSPAAWSYSGMGSCAHSIQTCPPPPACITFSSRFIAGFV